MRRNLSALAMLLVIASIGMVRPDPLFNTKWKIELVNSDGAAKDASDVIEFKAGKFTSTYFDKHGFKASDYDAQIGASGFAAFTMEQTSEKEGNLKWTGQVTAANIRGEVTWSKKDGSTVAFSFTGERLTK